MSEIQPKKIVVPKEDMENINKSIKKFMLMGVPKEEIDKYFYECIKARGKRMDETRPKKIWVDELEWGFGIKPEWDNAQYYIRADLFNELVEALEITAELVEALGHTAKKARAAAEIGRAME